MNVWTLLVTSLLLASCRPPDDNNPTQTHRGFHAPKSAYAYNSEKLVRVSSAAPRLFSPDDPVCSPADAVTTLGLRKIWIRRSGKIVEETYDFGNLSGQLHSEFISTTVHTGRTDIHHHACEPVPDSIQVFWCQRGVVAGKRPPQPLSICRESTEEPYPYHSAENIALVGHRYLNKVHRFGIEQRLNTRRLGLRINSIFHDVVGDEDGVRMRNAYWSRHGNNEFIEVLPDPAYLDPLDSFAQLPFLFLHEGGHHLASDFQAQSLLKLTERQKFQAAVHEEMLDPDFDTTDDLGLFDRRGRKPIATVDVSQVFSSATEAFADGVAMILRAEPFSPGRDPNIAYLGHGIAKQFQWDDLLAFLMPRKFPQGKGGWRWEAHGVGSVIVYLHWQLAAGDRKIFTSSLNRWVRTWPQIAAGDFRSPTRYVSQLFLTMIQAVRSVSGRLTRVQCQKIKEVVPVFYRVWIPEQFSECSE